MLKLSNISREKKLEILAKVTKDHTHFCENVLGLPKNQLEAHQNKIIKSVYKYPRTAVRSCHATGKTYTGSISFLSFFHTFPNTTAITTAPTNNLLDNQLWSEIRRQHKKSRVSLGGRLYDGKCEIRINDKWFGLGFVPRLMLSDSQSDFQGFHNDNILMLFDEATGIHKKIWEMAESMLSSGNVHWLAQGNPTDPASEFAKCFESPSWNKIHISCFDSPNLKANGICNIHDLEKEIAKLIKLSFEDQEERKSKYKVPVPYLINLRFVVEAYIKWGPDSPWFQSRVLGNFPAVSYDTLITSSTIQRALNRELQDNDEDFGLLGIDVARYGDDKTCHYIMNDKRVKEKHEYGKENTSYTAGFAIKLLKDNPNIKKVGIDDSGLGGGVTDQLENDPYILEKKIKIVPVNFGSKSNNPEKYANLKSEMFYLAAEDLKNNVQMIPCDETIAQLTNVKYKLTPKGQIRIESKDEMKKRGLSSPDFADAFVICNYMRHHVDKGEIETIAPVSISGPSTWDSV